MRRLSGRAALTVAAVVAGTLVNVAPAAASGYQPARPLTAIASSDWGNYVTGLFWRDPSDGGAGTNILDSYQSNSNAEDWTVQTDPRCGGQVTTNCPGGSISQDFVGRPIVTIKNNGQGSLCIRTAASTSWQAVMGTCDNGGSQLEPSSAFVQGFDSFVGGYRYYSVAYGLANTTEAALRSYTTADSNLHLSTTIDNATIWVNISS